MDLELISEWMDGLADDEYGKVIAALELLRDRGPHLGRPTVDTIKSDRMSNLKELRPTRNAKTSIRILFAFDKQSKAIMLLAGDKSGNWRKWYDQHVPTAIDRFERHQEKLEGK